MKGKRIEMAYMVEGVKGSVGEEGGLAHEILTYIQAHGNA